jgi:hypothetical protein
MRQHKVTEENPPHGPSVDEHTGTLPEIGDLDDTSRLPQITSNIGGIEVVEHSPGRAIGQWILQVRCECGRRWFEVEAIDSTMCPRCKRLVYVDLIESKP